MVAAKSRSWRAFTDSFAEKNPLAPRVSVRGVRIGNSDCWSACMQLANQIQGLRIPDHFSEII